MYSITLTFGGNTLALNHETGYDITTISGLSGVEGKIDTVHSNTGMGEVYTGGIVQGLSMTVQGYILDDEYAKRKQALLDLMPPLAEGTLTLYNINRNGRDIPYRAIDVVVRKSPQITQTRFCKFSFTLFAPQPFFRSLSSVSINASRTFEVVGSVPADFTMRIIVPANARLGEYIAYLDRHTDAQQYLYMDFRRLTAGYIEGFATVLFGRRKGKLYIESSSGGTVSNIIQVLHSNSEFFRLPPGEHSIEAYVKDEQGNFNNNIAWGLIYYPQYAGVALSGI